MASAAQVEKRAAGPRAGGKDLDDDAAEPRLIPLDLVPLVAPYKKHGRLSLRVERMPQQARLSKGTRNSDGSWSLTRDELEDLEFSIPGDAATMHKLAVRIIGLQGGNTLAVIEVPVVPAEVEAKAPAPAASAPAAIATAGVADDAQTRRLMDELGALKIILATRESELAEVKQQVGRAAPNASGKDVESELAAAREAWQREAQIAIAKAEETWKSAEAARFAAAEAKWRAQVDKKPAAVRPDPTQAAELKGLSEQLTALQATLSERDQALARAEGALEQAVAWKDGEAARLAEAEAAWRSRAANEIAAARAESDARTGEHGAALRQAREALASLQATLGERDAALAEARAALEQTRARALRDTQDALAKAERGWKDAEAERFKAAEAEWRAQSEKVVSTGGEQEAALKSLREQLTSLQGTLRQRERALASADKTFEQAREQWQREMHEAVAKAEKEFKAKEASRRTTTEAQARKEMAGALAHATARYEAAETALAQIRLKSPGNNARVEQELIALRASLDVREEELAQARAMIERLRGDGGHGADSADAPAGAPANRRYVRDAAIAACVGVVAVVLYLTVGPLVSAPAVAPPKPVEAAVAAPAPVAGPALPMASVTRDAKLRAQPDKGATVVAIVAKGRAVFVLEKREQWVRVQVEGGKPIEGWIRDTALKEMAPTSPTP